MLEENQDELGGISSLVGMVILFFVMIIRTIEFLSRD